ncbi:DUF58 domain-containing protein [Alteromonas lipolytica]|uniref:DUF58 domain-containing protein n=1 Tax=Alteromonas lipolytica TaxID=1856405 RepID=A0A1E8FE17_9ALTE|nr:DUF58 domain-containing protein [Alteromonas lipolytica]OFI34174.1 hypothetical protein BFC17_21800 [Alteromonas lipolytica]GGF84402.1 hypothetical protein GCM10011338_40900 [Alteromonas lipolytica]
MALNLNTLFDYEYLAQVQQLSLRIAQAGKGGRLAEQKTSARGQGLEFADFKPYVAGDDLRAIDWNIYRRLGRVFVRVFEEKQDMPVYFLQDASASMFYETTPRIVPALRATLGLAAIALAQHDSVSLMPFGRNLDIQVKGLNGKNNLLQFARVLAECESQAATSLTTAIKTLANLNLRKGLVVIVSDFFDNDGLQKVLAAMANLPHKVLLVQITQPWDAQPELMPEWQGELQIQDCETGAEVAVSPTPDVLKAYKQVYQQFNQDLLKAAQAQGAGLLQLDASQPVLPQLAGLFAQGGLNL